MLLKNIIRFLKTSPLLVPLLALIDLILYIVDRLAVQAAGPIQQKANKLLIMRIDVLGDYMLFRPYLKAIRQSAQYKDYAITLCANHAIRTVAEGFDGNLIDNFIWTDIYKLSTRPLYRFRFVRQLRQQGFSVVFCPTYSRVLVLDDFLSYATGAPKRAGCVTDFVNIKRWEAWFGDKLYTRLLPTGSGFVFEMERNRRVVEAFLNQVVPFELPRLDPNFTKPVPIPERFVVLSLAAGQDFKIWPAENFAEVARFILANYPSCKLVLTGMKSEIPYAEAFKKHMPDTTNVLDLTGSLSIPELVYVVMKAELLIANETGVVHIAASTQTPALVISQGKALVRWHPYPLPIGKYIHYLYPPFIEANRHRLETIAPMFKPESPYSIKDVSVEQVITSLKAVISLPIH
ncbi:glycosyltransferase family 9 protein [Spirosoma gilvum]